MPSLIPVKDPLSALIGQPASGTISARGVPAASRTGAVPVLAVRLRGLNWEHGSLLAMN